MESGAIHDHGQRDILEAVYIYQVQIIVTAWIPVLFYKETLPEQLSQPNGVS